MLFIRCDIERMKMIKTHLTLLLTCWILLIPDVLCEIKMINVGAIFHEESTRDIELAFNYTIKRLNQRFVLDHKRIILNPIIKHVPPKDSFKAGKIACQLAAQGIAAIFGPPSVETRGIVESTCKALEIPNIQFTWVPTPVMDIPVNDFSPTMSIKVHPHQLALSAALAALITDYDWETYTILYENDDGLIRLQEVFKKHGPKNLPISVYQLDADDNKELLKKVYNSGEAHIILDCEPENIPKHLRNAHAVKLMGNYQTYILSSLDAHTIDMSEFHDTQSNLTTFRILNPDSSELKSVVNDWNDGELKLNRNIFYNETLVKMDTGLVVDAVNHFGIGLRELMKTVDITPKPLSCYMGESWDDGFALINFLKRKSYYGLSGLMDFNEAGERNFFQLDIIELHKGVYEKIGTWNTEKNIEYTRSKERSQAIYIEKLRNTTLIVSSKLGPPFLTEVEAPEGTVLVGNDRYEGYCKDVIMGISEILNISFEFRLTEDGKYGAYDPDLKRWNGVVGQILERKADLGICDLTITYERKKVVDFSTPFMTLGISILFVKPTKEPPDLFSFLQPFSLDVWIFMATAYLGVSILLFVLARMAPLEWRSRKPYLKDVKELENVWNLRTVLWLSLIRGSCGLFPKMAPKEWANPHPCDPEPEELENVLTLLNSMWLALGSFLQQGSDILPKATSTRMVAGMWWFFTLIMISSYTANLAAFLTNERMDAPIKTAEDLTKQNKIKYGTLKGETTYKFFKFSNLTTYSRIWSAMETARPSVFVDSNAKGIDRVLKSKRKYAYFMESTTLEYNVNRNCDLTQIGGLLDSKGYGITLPKNSPLRTLIDEAILKMQENGKLMELKKKWWVDKNGGGACSEKKDEDSSSSAAELGIGNVGGVFVVLGFGCFIAFILGICEFLWNVRQISVEQMISFKEAFRGEMTFAVNIWKTTKPINTKTESDHSLRSVSRDRENSQPLDPATSSMRLDKIF